MRHSLRSALGLVTAIACLALPACSDNTRDVDFTAFSEEMAAGGAMGSAAEVPPAAPAPDQLKSARSRGLATAADIAAPPQAPPSPITPAAEAGAEGSMIIRTGESRIEVDSLERGIEAVQGTAKALGGWIAQSSLTLGDRQQRSARLEVKLPSARWDELLAGLEGIGELQQLSTATEDVGEQFVDLSAQLSNSERLEERYLQLLETRTGSLEDVLAVERELARVRERIETLQGRLRYLSQRVAISTMFVNLEEPVDLLAFSPDSEPIRDAFRAAWQNFLGVITGGIALLGGVLPLAVILGGVVWGWRRVRRRRGVGEA